MTENKQSSPLSSGESTTRTRHILCPNEKELLVTLDPSMLRRRGIEVHSFESGHQALDLAQKFPPALCITLQSMTDMEAKELATRLHEMHGEEFLPLVLMIGENESDPGPLDPRYFAGSITHPIDSKALSVLIGKLIGIHLREAERFPIRVRVFSDEYMGTTLNISAKGMLVRTDKALKPSSMVEIRFALPGSSRRMTVQGQVVRSDKEIVKPQVAVAFRFDPLSFEDHQFLEDYITSLVTGRSFVWEKEETQGITRLRLLGRLQRKEDLSNLPSNLQAPFELDLSGLKKIHASCHQGWKNWLGDIGNTQSPIIISSVSYTLAQQLSGAPCLYEGTQIRAICAVHVCEECETERLFDVPMDKIQTPPTQKCPLCKGEMTLDEPLFHLK